MIKTETADGQIYVGLSEVFAPAVGHYFGPSDVHALLRAFLYSSFFLLEFLFSQKTNNI